MFDTNRKTNLNKQWDFNLITFYHKIQFNE